MGDIDTYRELIHSKNPILGKPMRRKLLGFLGDAAIYGEADAVELLAEAVTDESVDPDVQAIARKAPWTGQPALMASDGLFSFGCHPME